MYLRTRNSRDSVKETEPTLCRRPVLPGPDASRIVIHLHNSNTADVRQLADDAHVPNGNSRGRAGRERIAERFDLPIPDLDLHARRHRALQILQSLN